MPMTISGCGTVATRPLTIDFVSPTQYEDGFWETAEEMGMTPVIGGIGWRKEAV